MKRILSLILLWCLPAQAQEPAERPRISLDDVRWQSLPRGVDRVFVGPDGRTWFQGNSREARPNGPRPRPTLEGVKRGIERAFPHASPYVEDVRILLFEPGGRVWFSFTSGRRMVVLGYDGKAWTDDTILDGGDMISGHCATRGELLEGRTNRYAGGAAWFITFRGVLRFDGQRWQHRRFADQPDQPVGFGNAHPDDAVWLAVSPDGQAAVAYAGVTGRFWSFQAGTWEPFPFLINGRPGEPGTRPRRGLLGLVMPGPKSAYLLGTAGILQALPATPGARNPTDDLIAALKDHRYATREDATRQLLGMGPAIRSALEEALGRSTDLEQKSRLESILVRIRTTDPMEVESTLGKARIAGCRQLYEDGSGRVVATATKLDGRDGGVAILEPDGSTTTLMGERFASAWAMSYGGDRPPIFAPSGEQVWLSNRGTGEPPRLLDLKKREFVGSLPHPEYSRLHAVSAEGRVFASVALPAGIRPIGVYTPAGARDPEAPLQVSRIAAFSHQWAITDEGTVWAHGLEGLKRFDGLEWADIPHAREEQPGDLLPGRHDAMLVWSEDSATLYEGSQEVGAGDRSTLLQKHRPGIRKAFGPGEEVSRVFGVNTTCGVQVDRAGNVWCWEPSGRLRVEVDGAWSDADAALKEAGSRDGRVTDVVLIGDGSRLYVRARDTGRSPVQAFFAQVRDGKPHCTPAPRDVDWYHPPRNHFDRDGGFWIGSSSTTGTLATRVGRDGGVEEVRNAGIPLLADEAGHVWFCDSRGPIQDNFQLWRKGQRGQTLVIPKADLDTFLFSDKPGSVYAWTVAGLQHLVAEGPGFDSYRLDKLHPVEGILGQPLSKGYSKHGYLAVMTALDTRTEPHYHLYLIRLPK